MLYVDNKDAIQLAEHPTDVRSTKHIDNEYHSIREKVVNGEIVLNHVQNSKQLADIFTKRLPKEAFKHLRQLNGMREKLN